MTQKCFNHPKINAVGTCRYCGRDLCQECLLKKENIIFMPPKVYGYKQHRKEEYFHCKDEDGCLDYQAMTFSHKKRREKISASEAERMYLGFLAGSLTMSWQKMAKKLSPILQIPKKQLSGLCPQFELAVESTVYHDLPKLFDEDVTGSLRRSIWDRIAKRPYCYWDRITKRPHYGSVDVLSVYLKTMEAAEEEGKKYLSAAAAVLYYQLASGEFIISTEPRKRTSPTATKTLTELFMVFGLNWWTQLKSKFEVIK